MQSEPFLFASDNRAEVEARAEKQHVYRAHVFTCAICCEDEDALCAEGHRLLVAALK